jgi:hypothetical protein
VFVIASRRRRDSEATRTPSRPAVLRGPSAGRRGRFILGVHGTGLIGAGARTRDWRPSGRRSRGKHTRATNNHQASAPEGPTHSGKEKQTNKQQSGRKLAHRAKRISLKSREESVGSLWVRGMGTVYRVVHRGVGRVVHRGPGRRTTHQASRNFVMRASTSVLGRPNRKRLVPISRWALCRRGRGASARSRRSGEVGAARRSSLAQAVKLGRSRRAVPAASPICSPTMAASVAPMRHATIDPTLPNTAARRSSGIW